MYYRVKNISVKGNKLFVTAAANNVRPITYSKEEYDAKEEDLREKVRSFAISALEGNFQATGRCNKESFWEYAETIKVKYQLLESNFSCDRWYDLNRESELEELIADLVLVPLFFDEPVDFDEAKRILTNFDRDSKFMYEVMEKRFKEEGKIIVTSAWRCDIIPGTDVVYTKDNKWYLCKADHYNNHGILDNADNSAIELDDNNYELRRVLLGYDISKETFDEINKLKGMMEEHKYL